MQQRTQGGLVFCKVIQELRSPCVLSEYLFSALLLFLTSAFWEAALMAQVLRSLAQPQPLQRLEINQQMSFWSFSHSQNLFLQTKVMRDSDAMSVHNTKRKGIITNALKFKGIKITLCSNYSINLYTYNSAWYKLRQYLVNESFLHWLFKDQFISIVPYSKIRHL